MAFALVANVAKAGPLNGGTASSAIDTTGATLTAGSMSWYNPVTADATLTDSKGNTYTGLTKKISSDTSNRLFYCANPVVGSGHTFTPTGTTSAPSIQMGAWSGGSTFDVQNGATGAGDTLAPGSITPTENNELVITGVRQASTNPADITIDSGFTITDKSAEAAGSVIGGAMAHLIQTSAAAVNPLWTQTGPPGLIATIASFKAAAAGSAIKTIMGLALASVKTVNGLAIASVKTVNGLA